MRRVLLVSAILLGVATPAVAQSTSAPSRHPVFLIGGHYGAPAGLSGTAGVLIAPGKPLTPGTAPDSSRTGLVLKGVAGSGGFGAAAGVAALALEGPFLTTGFDALFTVTRTGHRPEGAAVDSTYAGVEAGLVIMSVRLSAGVAQRIAGSSGSRATIFTWTAGVQLPLGW